MGTDPTRPTPPPAPARRSPVAAPPVAIVVSGGWQIEGLPATVRRAGPQAAERTVEFFTAQIRNPHTRAAYTAAVTRFFTWWRVAPELSGQSPPVPPRAGLFLVWVLPSR